MSGIRLTIKQNLPSCVLIENCTILVKFSSAVVNCLGSEKNTNAGRFAMNLEIRTVKVWYLEENDFLCRQSDHIIKSLRLSFLICFEMLKFSPASHKNLGEYFRPLGKTLLYACQIHRGYNLVK